MSLLDGQVQAWLADVEDALARLLGTGLLHPDAELPEALGLLAERGERLGAGAGARSLRRLADGTGALRPGPVDRAARVALADGLFDELMGLAAWHRLLRADLALTEAGLRARGQHGEQRPDPGERRSGRVWVDGLALDEHGVLRIVGHMDDDTPVLLLDPLGDPDRDDLFARLVVSRLFQDLVDLRELGRCAVELERHPVDVRGGVVIGRPAFRAVPRRITADGDAPRTRHVERVRVEVRGTADGLRVRDVTGRELEVGRTLAFNLRKRIADGGEGSVELVVRSGAGGRRVIGALEDGRRTFPTVDARAWRVDPHGLLRAATDADEPWIRACATLFGGGGATGYADAAHDATTRPWAGTDLWRWVWWAARTGLEPRGDEPDDDLASVWLGCWRGQQDVLAAAWERYAERPEPTLVDVAVRSLLLDAVAGDRAQALDYLEAHRLALVQRASGGPLPPALDLLVLADVRAWLRGEERAGPVVDGLGLGSVALRERCAAALMSWRLGGPASGVGDELALAASASWGASVVGEAR